MSSLLDGLSDLGLGNLQNIKVYEEPKAQEIKKHEVVNKSTKVEESDLIFLKTYHCPNCDEDIKVYTAKNGKAHLISTDIDLRPKHEGIDMVKYDVIACPHCGFSALARYFNYLSPSQSKKISELISVSFKGLPAYKECYSYEEAISRYQLALACAIVKQAKDSEKAFICLKAGWLLRGYQDSLQESNPDNINIFTFLEKENEYLLNAFEGFINARMKEAYPMCGMDEATVDYIIAALGVRFEKYDVASKLISKLITNTSTNPRMKDKARDLKDIILSKMKVMKEN